MIDAALIGDEDPGFAGGSYVHRAEVPARHGGVERAVDGGAGARHRPHQALRHRAGRRREADLGAHRADHDRRGRQRAEDPARQHAVRRVGKGEFGTYFIGYRRSPRATEQMLENMFIGDPPGNYDRILDFSRAVTGSLFFVPSATFLETSQDADAGGCDASSCAGGGRPAPSPASPTTVHSASAA